MVETIAGARNRKGILGVDFYVNEGTTFKCPLQLESKTTGMKGKLIDFNNFS